MDTLKLQNGDLFPQIGLGTWKSKDEEVKEAVKYALEIGYKHIDCAKNYANETAVGEAFQSVFSQGKVKREDVWITSKLWNNAHKKEDVIPALKQTLQDLQLDYLDLYLIHWPVAFTPETENFPQKDSDYLSLEEVPLAETWEQLLEAKKQGLIRHAGVSNFTPHKLEKLAQDTGEMPEVLQVELHPFLPQNDLLEFCRKNKILLTGYSPLGSGDRIEAMKAPNEPSLLRNETIQKIAQKHDCNPGQVLIQWAVQRGTAVIPKSTNKEHIRLNLESADLKLDSEDLETIKNIGVDFRYVDGEFFVTPGNPYEAIFG